MGLLSRAASIFGLKKSAAGNPADDRYFEPFLPANPAGLKVTPESALKCAAVFRCVAIWMDIVSTLPYAIYQLRQDGVIDGGMDPAPNHPVFDLLALAPNNRDTPAEFWSTMIFHAMLRGVAYAEIKPGPRGAVNTIEPIHPDRIPANGVEVLPDGTIRVKVLDPKTQTYSYLLQEELLRIRGMSSDGVTALRTIDFATDAIALCLAADQSAARVFSNNLNMGGFLTHPGKLGNDGVERLRSRLMARFAGVTNLWTPAILQEGMKWTPSSMNLQEAQLLESRKAQVRDISNYFGGVPLHLLGIDDGTGRSAVEDQWINFVRVGVRPFIERLEQSMRRDLIIAPRHYVARINLDSLERGNMAARAEYFSKALGTGGSPAWLHVNEVRTAEGYNKDSDPAADKLALGTNPQSQPATPADKKKPANNDDEQDDDDAQPADRSGSGAQQSEADYTRQRAEYLVRREVSVLRRIHIRHASDSAAFRKAVEAFYGGFATQVAERLGIGNVDAKAWCKKRSARVGGANDIAAVLDALEDEIDQAAGTAAPGET